LDAIEDIRSLVQGRTLEAFAADRISRMAIERLLEIVSEASRYIPEEIKAKGNDIPWRRIGCSRSRP
jgi:uncharacterized protein with HEPN domain